MDWWETRGTADDAASVGALESPALLEVSGEVLLGSWMLKGGLAERDSLEGSEWRMICAGDGMRLWIESRRWEDSNLLSLVEVIVFMVNARRLDVD